MEDKDDYKYYLNSVAILLNVHWDMEMRYPIEEVTTRIYQLMSKGHNFEFLWLTDDLEGFRCSICGLEVIEVDINIEPCMLVENIGK